MPKRFIETISGKVYRFLKKEAYLKHEISLVDSNYIAKKLNIKKDDVRDAKWWLKQQNMVICTKPGEMKLNTSFLEDKRRCELVCGKYHGARCDKGLCPLNHLLVKNKDCIYNIEFNNGNISQREIPLSKKNGKLWLEGDI